MVDISTDVWALILHFVPFTQRLEHCSVVSKGFHQAVVAATQEVILRPVHVLDGFMHWLEHPHQHLTSLEMWGPRPLLQLPCQHLSSLRLYNCTIQLAPTSGEGGILRDCTRLTQLLLSNCSTTEPDLSVLCSLSHMQHLHLGLDRHPQRMLLPTTILSHMTQLTMLSLRAGICLTEASLQHLSSLQDLRRLNIDVSSSSSSGLTAASFMCLQACQHLQALQVGHMQACIIAATAPAFLHLTSLTLMYGSLDPTAIASLTQLQHLELVGLAVPGAAAPEGTGAGGAVLLAVLAQLKQMQSLRMHRLDCQWPLCVKVVVCVGGEPPPLQGVEPMGGTLWRKKDD